MAGQQWDWFEREEFIGQISDIRVQNLQVEREAVQKRTFTRWMNLHLEKCDPPLQVEDLFQDIQDGHVLMSLLEELSGCKLLHGFKRSSHRIFRLNNIAKVLSFLEERNVKLVSIDAADVADGNSSIILGLIWNIILFFQIKELTGNIRSQFPSCSSLSSIPTSSDSDTSHSSTPSEERPSAAAAMRENSRVIKKLLQWVQKRTRRYSVAVHDFGKSWTSGLAFLAVIKSIDGSLVDMRKALLRSSRENLEDAFRIAHYSLGIPRLLEPEDVAVSVPDEQSIIMYVSQFLEHFPGLEEPEESCQLIERSVSMGRLHDGDWDRGGRVRGRALMFQKDQPTNQAKILVSSVSVDRSVPAPRLRAPAARSWSSEDFLADPPTAGSPDSVVGDSAIGSPDSWLDGERVGRGDGSAWDGGADLYRATPVDVTPLDEGFLSSLEDRVPDEEETSSLDQNQNQADPTLRETERPTETETEAGPVQQIGEPTEPSLTPRDDWTGTRTEDPEAGRQNRVQWVGHRPEPDGMMTEGRSEPEPQDERTGSETFQGGDEGTRTFQNHISESTEQEPEPRLNIPLIAISSEPDQNQESDGDDGGLSRTQINRPQSPDGQNRVGGEDDDRVRSEEPPGPMSENTEPEPPETQHVDDGSYWTHSTGTGPETGSGHDSSQTGSDVIAPPPSNAETTDQDRSPNQEPDRHQNRPTDASPHNETEETQQNLLDPNDTEQNLFDPDDTHQNLLDPNDTKQNLMGPNYTQQNLFGPNDTKQNLMGPNDTQQNLFGPDDTHQNLFGPDDMHQNLFSPDDTQQNLLDPIDTHQNLLDPDDTQQNLLDPIDTQQNLLDPIDTQQNLLDPNDTHQNLFGPEDTQQNLLDPNDTHQNLFGPDDTKQKLLKADDTHQNLLQPIDTQQNLFGPDDTQQNLFGPDDTQQNLLDPATLKPNGQIVTSCSEPANMDLFYSDFDQSSPSDDPVGDPVEPMDLFYPDKEDPGFPDPPDSDMERWPSVLSVSALQPAPASDADPEDRGPDLMEDQEDGDVIRQTVEESSDPEQCMLCGVTIDVLEDGGDLRAEAERRDGRSSSRPEEIQIPPVLRHRKGAHRNESTNHQRAAPRGAHDEDSDFWENWELYLLLLLWLLLYSFWLLPQLDLKTLPSLLLNLDR